MEEDPATNGELAALKERVRRNIKKSKEGY